VDPIKAALLEMVEPSLLAPCPERVTGHGRRPRRATLRVRVTAAVPGVGAWVRQRRSVRRPNSTSRPACHSATGILFSNSWPTGDS